MTVFYVDHWLNDLSIEKATLEAKRRQQINEGHRLQGRNLAPASGESALRIHVLGAKGELAVAQYLNIENQVFTDLVPTRGSVDLPPNIDVKTRSKHWMDLVVQLDDDPKKVFVHATSEDRNVRLHGWTYGSRVMKKCFEKDPANGRPAYFVTPSVLHPMQLLKTFMTDLGYSK